MNDKRKSPLFIQAVLTTTAALLNLSVCLSMIANRSTAGPTQMWFNSVRVPILLAMFMIAGAVAMWVFYFRSYVDFRIDQLRQEQQGSVSQPPPAPAPANA